MEPQFRLLISFLLIASALSNPITNVDESRYACNSNESQKQPPNRINTEKQLAALRDLMKLYSNGNDTIDALFITTDDEHQSEFVSNYNQRLKYVSGFSGSNGHVVVTKNKAALWTDGRYHIQADEEVDCNWLLMKAGNPKVPTISSWLLSEFPQGARIEADAKIVSAKEWTTLEFALNESNSNFRLTKMDKNFVDQIWIDHNATQVITDGFILNDTFAGKTWLEKVEAVRTELKDLSLDGFVITALDEVAWLLNVRGGDNTYSNLMDAYAVVTLADVTLYVNPAKIESEIRKYFENYTDLLKFRNEEDFWNDLPLLVQKCNKILVPSPRDFNKGASKEIFDSIPKTKRAFVVSPIIYLKAEKDSVERLGMNRAHVRDSAALCRFLHFFESSFNSKKEVWDELRVVEYVNMFRSKQDFFLGLSFGTIAGFGPHGALPHYQPTKMTSSLIFDNDTIVIDSGGQYYDGTTDVTRTVHLGAPQQKHKEAYTRVLMGSIQLSAIVFPEGLRTENLDVLARSPMWQIGYDYPHGTGHGIGASLNVHESPISVHYKNVETPFLKPGYFFSNEPGYYKKDDFGVRLENIMEVVNVTKKNSKWFYGFNTVTLVPYDTKLIDLDMLDRSHIRWLNTYNSRIRELVGKELMRQNATDAYNWMMINTEAIPLHQ